MSADYTKRTEVMNSPASAALGAEVRDLNMVQRHGTGAVPQGMEAQATQPSAAPTLWCVHIIGPDDVYPAPSEAEAERAVAFMTQYWETKEVDPELRAMVGFEAIPWPYSTEVHAKSVGQFYKEIGFSPPPSNTSISAPKENDHG